MSKTRATKFSKKILIQLYFIFFIFLNIIDFLNIIVGDLDFFKKILSWTLIGYIFYKTSLTKIFIGKRIKSYDIGFIIVFCLFTIPKSLLLYTRNISQDLTAKYFIFEPVFQILIQLNFEQFLQITFISATLLTLILAIALRSNNNVEEKSFIGSFKFKESYFKYIYEQLILIFILLFFGLIVFNLFMEWFALAVDAIILILGLIYYIFVYIHSHMTSKLSKLLQDISNSGNNFYQSLIKMFSDKKTLFLGISFLLTLHMLVDVGVYLIPYTIGTQNTLYFNSLDYANTDIIRTHTPIFSLNSKNFNKSVFYQDMTSASDNPILILSLLIIDIISIFSLGFLMIMPFFIFYKNSIQKKVKLKPILVISLLTSMILALFINIFKNISWPLNIGYILPENQVRGVDIYTQSIIGQNISSTSFGLLASMIILFTSSTILFLLHKKYAHILNKILYMIILIFFVTYITIFFTDTVQTEYNSMKNDVLNNNIFNNITNVNSYNDAYKIYLNNNYYKSPQLPYQNPQKTIKAMITLFSDLKIANTHYVENKNHTDYLLVEVEKYDTKSNVFCNLTNTFFEEESTYNINKEKFTKTKFNMIYKIGENTFPFNLKSSGRYTPQIVPSLLYLDKYMQFKKYDPKSDSQKVVEYIRLVLLSLFYICGTIAFIFYYTKNNLMDNKNEF